MRAPCVLVLHLCSTCAAETLSLTRPRLLLQFKAGDKVYCCSSTYVAQTPELQGTYAEYCILKDSWVALAPSTLTLVDAAAVPLVALTAVQALDKAESSPGQRILITGASGGVGHIAVQLAKLDYKLHVTAAASAKHREWMRALGADEVVDYTVGIQQCLAPFTGNKFDIILDVIGGEFLDYATKNVLKEGGIVSEVMNRGTGESDVAKEQGAGVRFATTLIQPNGAQLKHLAEHIDAGKLKVKVAQRYPLEQAGAAQEEVLAGHAGGKVVLTI